MCGKCGATVPKKYMHTRVITSTRQLPKGFPTQWIEQPTLTSARKRPVIKFVDLHRTDIPPYITTLYRSRSGHELYDSERTYCRTKRGYKYNHLYEEDGSHYQAWISGPHRDGMDCLYPGIVMVDEEIRETYWRDIRGLPQRINDAQFRSPGLYTKRSRGKKDGSPIHR